MPGKFEIMRAVCEGLNSLEVSKGEGPRVWGRAVKTKLCEIGQGEFGCYVCASGVDEAANHGEWLYDVTWLEYERDSLKSWPATALIEAHLVAECEWGNFEEIVYDFEKLLLAHARVRLMIFDHNWAGVGSKEIVERLAGKVREFNGSHAEDTWLLADWEQEDWSFRCFTIDANHQAIPFPAPSGG